MLRYYARLIWDAVWKSAGTFSRGLTIALLALTAASVVVPWATALGLPSASTWVGVVLVALLVVYEVAQVNYRRVEGFQRQLAALEHGRPRFEFGLKQQRIETPEPNRPEFLATAEWFRVSVRNTGGNARNCMLALETVSADDDAAPGPLATTGLMAASRDITTEGILFYDLAYVFNSDWGGPGSPASVYLCTMPKPQRVRFRNRMQVSVRFTDDQGDAHYGRYDFVQDAPGGGVWVDAEHALS